MAADAPTNNGAVNPCCSVWKERCLKLEEGRKWLRQAVKVLNEQVDKIQIENINLKKANDEERTKVENFKEARDREMAAKVSLENEVSALKSEISILKQNACVDAEHREGEIKLLQDRVSRSEEDIERLKRLLVIEKERADTEKRNAEAERKSAAEAWNVLQKEKTKANEERIHAICEEKKAEEILMQLEESKCEANKVKSRLTMDYMESEEISSKVEKPIEVGEKEQPGVETESRGKDLICATTFLLENEILTLKSKISLLQENENINVEDSKGLVRHLQDSAFIVEKGIIELTKLLNKERDRADFEKKTAEEGKKNASTAWDFITGEGKKAEECRRQVDIINEELVEVKSKLKCEGMKLEEINRKLEAERTRVTSEHARAEKEKKEREREYALRVSLESEICALKAQLSLSLQKGVADSDCRKQEMNNLQNLVSEREKEIKQLKQLLEKEKTRADHAKKKAESEKKSAAQAWECVKVEKAKTEEEVNQTNIVSKKANDYYLQLERLKKEAKEAKAKLVAETLKFEGANKKLEAESHKLTKERRRADLEMAKAEKQRKIAEANGRKIVEEKSRVESLSLQLANARKNIDELQKEIRELQNVNGEQPVNQDIGISAEPKKHQMEALKKELEEANKRLEAGMLKMSKERSRADMEMIKAEEQRKLAKENMLMAMEEKSRADLLSHKLDEQKHKIEELEKKMLENLPFRKVVESFPILPYKDSNFGAAKVSQLEKQLKLEKILGKHAKKVAKLEKNRTRILQQELSHLRLEVSQLTEQLDILDRCFSPSSQGTRGIEKGGEFADVQRPQLKRKHCSLESSDICCQNYCDPLGNIHMAAFDIPKSHWHTASPPPVSGVTFTETISGKGH